MTDNHRGTKNPRSTVLTQEEEQIICEFRRLTRFCLRGYICLVERHNLGPHTIKSAPLPETARPEPPAARRRGRPNSMDFLLAYNFQRPLKALKYQPPYDTIMDIYQQKPELFHPRPIQKTLGLNIYTLSMFSGVSDFLL